MLPQHSYTCLACPHRDTRSRLARLYRTISTPTRTVLVCERGGERCLQTSRFCGILMPQSPGINRCEGIGLVKVQLEVLDVLFPSEPQDYRQPSRWRTGGVVLCSSGQSDGSMRGGRTLNEWSKTAGRRAILVYDEIRILLNSFDIRLNQSEDTG
jgi:hypothetical protein